MTVTFGDFLSSASLSADSWLVGYDTPTTNGERRWKASTLAQLIKAPPMVLSATSTEPILRITQSGTGNALLVEDDSSTDSTPFVVTADGRLGVGTSSPISKVNIVEENENAFRISNNELHQYYASFGCILSAGYFTAGSSENRDVPLIFRTALAGAETEKFRIAADGKVGIGTTTPNEKLTVVGNISATGDLYARSVAVSSLSLQGPVTETKATPSIVSNTLTLNLAEASLFYVTMNAEVNTLTIQNVPASPRVYSFTLQTEGNGTVYTINWPASFRWPNGTQPTLTSTANKVDIYTFMTHDGGVNWFAFTSSQNH